MFNFYYFYQYFCFYHKYTFSFALIFLQLLKNIRKRVFFKYNKKNGRNTTISC